MEMVLGMMFVLVMGMVMVMAMVMVVVLVMVMVVVMVMVMGGTNDLFTVIANLTVHVADPV